MCAPLSLFQSDVFAFGVLMLRLATNLPAWVSSPQSAYLHVHVRDALFGEGWEGRACRPEDVAPAKWAALAATAAGPACAWGSDDALARFGALALRCTEADREDRPLMADVASSLEGMLAAQGGGSSIILAELSAAPLVGGMASLSLGRGVAARGPTGGPAPPPPLPVPAVVAISIGAAAATDASLSPRQGGVLPELSIQGAWASPGSADSLPPCKRGAVLFNLGGPIPTPDPRVRRLNDWTHKVTTSRNVQGSSRFGIITLSWTALLKCPRVVGGASLSARSPPSVPPYRLSPGPGQSAAIARRTGGGERGVPPPLQPLQPVFAVGYSDENGDERWCGSGTFVGFRSKRCPLDDTYSIAAILTTTHILQLPGFRHDSLLLGAFRGSGTKPVACPLLCPVGIVALPALTNFGGGIAIVEARFSDELKTELEELYKECALIQSVSNVAPTLDVAGYRSDALLPGRHGKFNVADIKSVPEGSRVFEFGVAGNEALPLFSGDCGGAVSNSDAGDIEIVGIVMSELNAECCLSHHGSYRSPVQAPARFLLLPSRGAKPSAALYFIAGNVVKPNSVSFEARANATSFPLSDTVFDPDRAPRPRAFDWSSLASVVEDKVQLFLQARGKNFEQWKLEEQGIVLARITVKAGAASLGEVRLLSFGTYNSVLLRLAMAPETARRLTEVLEVLPFFFFLANAYPSRPVNDYSLHSVDAHAWS